MSKARDIASIVPDATALKALAHPTRVRMLGLLRLEGPATATSLAGRIGLNSGATSYHLRQLEKHGFIEEDIGMGSARERFWRARHESTSFLQPGATPAERESGFAFAQAALSEQVRQMQRAVEAWPQLSPEWQAATSLNDFTFALTAEEAQALVKRIEDLLWEASRNAPPLAEGLAQGLTAFTVMTHAFPYPREDGGEGGQ